jgi:hypothetical protein
MNFNFFFFSEIKFEAKFDMHESGNQTVSLNVVGRITVDSDIAPLGAGSIIVNCDTILLCWRKHHWESGR